MRLSILTVELSDFESKVMKDLLEQNKKPMIQRVKLPKNIKPFRYYPHHIKEIFLILFPKNVGINDSSKIAIVFGPRGDEPIFNNVLGVTNYFIEVFNLKKFYELSDSEKEMFFLENIKNSLINIVNNNSKDEEIIKQITSTADRVIESKFSLEIEVKKLSKISIDKKYKISVYRVLNKEVGEGWKYIKTNRKTKQIIEENWLENIPNYLNRTDFYKRSEIYVNEYVIKDYLGSIRYKMII